MLKVYLSGPEVFFPDVKAVFEAKTALCRAHGFAPIVPGDGEFGAEIADPTLRSRAYYHGNVDAMREADFGIFNLTPFRGASADAGTVFELGFMVALDKPVFGYTNVAGDYIERIEPRRAAPSPNGQPMIIDADGFMVEDFGNADNLMVDSALASGGPLMVRPAPGATPSHADLAGFRRCLELARARIDVGDS